MTTETSNDQRVRIRSGLDLRISLSNPLEDDVLYQAR